MQELPKLHRNYSSGAIIGGSVHPNKENILLLRNIDMYNYIAVLANKLFSINHPNSEVKPPNILDFFNQYLCTGILCSFFGQIMKPL